METFKKDKLVVNSYDTIFDMGKAAAKDVADAICAHLANNEEVNMIFAAAPSQNELLINLTSDPRVDWTRVNAFHMDEYVGLDSSHPQSFGAFLRERIFGKLPFKSVNYINGAAISPEEECSRYAALLEEKPVDIVCMGIGENGHIAFNDPPVANFNDKVLVKKVALELVCRQQQVNEKCFDSLDLVPKFAFSLTVPALLRASKLFCVVPFANKAQAVKNTLTWEISEACPATALRTHNCATLYLDPDSSQLL